MTASRTWRSRSVRDATMSPKLLPANNLDRPPGAGQVADEGVEAHPPLAPPGGQAVGRTGGTRQSRIGAQREVQALEFPLLLGQDFLGLDRRQPGDDRAPIGLPCGQIPATHPAV